MKCKLLRDMDSPTGRKAAGTVIDHRDAYKLVRLGVATPSDPECDEAAGLTAEQIAELGRRYDRLEQGMLLDQGDAAEDEQALTAPIDELELQAADIERLRAGGLQTIAAVAAHEDLTQLAGIGAVARDRILAAVEAWRHR